MKTEELAQQLQERAQQHQLFSNEILRLEGEIRLLQQLHNAALALEADAPENPSPTDSRS